MLKHGICTTVLVALVMTAVPAFAAVTFLYPADKSVVRRSDYLIVKVNSLELTGVRIDVNGVPGDLLGIGSNEYRKAFRDIVIVQPVWDPGKNRVRVAVFKGNEQVEAAEAEFFFQPGTAAAKAPPGYAAFVMHTAEREKQCAPCHVMNPTPAQLANPDTRENPCLRCHKRMLDTGYVHGPAGTGSCSYCHLTAGTPRYAPKKREAELCFDCHSDKKKEFSGWKYLHGPVAAGLCETCHDPHGGPVLGQLRQPINALCLSCHRAVGREPHVTRISTGGGHPLGGVPDPSKPNSGRELSCISCHNPHGADARYYFPAGQTDRMQLCQMCHRK